MHLILAFMPSKTGVRVLDLNFLELQITAETVVGDALPTHSHLPDIRTNLVINLSLDFDTVFSFNLGHVLAEFFAPLGNI